MLLCCNIWNWVTVVPTDLVYRRLPPGLNTLHWGGWLAVPRMPQRSWIFFFFFLVICLTVFGCSFLWPRTFLHLWSQVTQLKALLLNCLNNDLWLLNLNFWNLLILVWWEWHVHCFKKFSWRSRVAWKQLKESYHWVVTAWGSQVDWKVKMSYTWQQIFFSWSESSENREQG